MKKTNFLFTVIVLLIAAAITFIMCRRNEKNIYDRLLKYSRELKVINTHEHQHHVSEMPAKHFCFYQLLASSYLNGDVISAGADSFDTGLIDTAGPDNLWTKYGAYLDYSSNTSYYRHLVDGFRILYNFKDLYFTKNNIETLSDQIEQNYSDFDNWFGEAFAKAGFETMFLDQYWNPFNTNVDSRYFTLVFHINPLIADAAKKPGKGEEHTSVYRLAESADFPVNNLDDYLNFCDLLLRKNIESKAVCLKNSQAYSRTLYYEDVPYDEAKILYDKNSAELKPEEIKKLEDFMFHWIVKKSIEYDLPVQIHTGYLAGNGNILGNSNPLKLNNLFIKYPEAKFDLFHGSFPWTAEFASLGKMFPNVYLNLVWLPQISRQEALNALNVIFDCVPYNKILWGGDCHVIEESAGSIEYFREILAEVLSDRIQKGMLTEKNAYEIIKRILRDNPVEIFRLEERLGKSFD